MMSIGYKGSRVSSAKCLASVDFPAPVFPNIATLFMPGTYGFRLPGRSRPAARTRQSGTQQIQNQPTTPPGFRAPPRGGMMTGLMARSLTRSAVGEKPAFRKEGELLRSPSACRLNRAHPASQVDFSSPAGQVSTENWPRPLMGAPAPFDAGDAEIHGVSPCRTCQAPRRHRQVQWNRGGSP